MTWDFYINPNTVTTITVTQGAITETLYGELAPTPFGRGFSTSSFVDGTTVTISADGYQDETVTVGTFTIELSEASNPYYVSNLSDGTNTYIIKDANAANKDLSNVSSNIDYVVESYQNGTEWYRLYKSGWVEQGGYISATSSSISNKSVTLQVAMASATYNVQKTLQGGADVGGTTFVWVADAISSTSKTATKVYLSVPSTSYVLGCYWQVSGMSAQS